MSKWGAVTIAALCLTACAERKDTGVPTITVTIEPQRYFTEAIAGEHYRVQTMVPAGVSPETYDPTPQQLANLSRSAAYFRIGYIGFEQSWMDRLMANAPAVQVFDLSQGINLIREADDEHEHHHGHHHHAVEPHIWNSATNAQIIARNICSALCELDSIHAAAYITRCDSLCRCILQTDSIIREVILQPEAPTAFIIYHPALSYFARDYALSQMVIEEDGKEPSAAHLKALIDEARAKHVRTVFVQPEFDRRHAEIIASQVGATVLPINPLNYDWETEIINTARALRDEADR